LVVLCVFLFKGGVFFAANATLNKTHNTKNTRQQKQQTTNKTKQRLTVAIPFLWGVPPELEQLEQAIAQGGGIVHHVQQQWCVYGGGTSTNAGVTASQSRC
jgi:hypothetical protein